VQSPDPSKGPGSGTYKAREGKLAAVLDESASLCSILGLDEFLFRIPVQEGFAGYAGMWGFFLL
jgi:hypothetical protein